MLRKELGIVLCVAAMATASASLFTDAERGKVVQFWSAPGRYTVHLPEKAQTQGPYQVRLSVPASVWLREYNRKRGMNKVPPTTTAAPQNDEQRVWQVWIDGKIEWDRWNARQDALQRNHDYTGQDSKLDDRTLPTSAPDDPGPAPAGLVAFAGAPPAFAQVVQPLVHEVVFPDGTRLAFQDNVKMRKNYAYYRFEHGVASEGTPVKTAPAGYIDKLFAQAGATEAEARVMKAVSLLEGGFDAINTYDTGYVTAGFIQFATLKDGGNSLGDMLKQYKADDPDDFQRDFRAFGIDVTDDAKIACVDPTTGAELSGEAAVQKFIDDPRLIAVFAYDGQKSDAYNAEQIRSAKAQFFPGNDVLKFDANGVTLTGKVGDVVRSEAGLATLMDRKVNTGHIDSTLIPVLRQIAVANGVTRWEDLAPFEYDIVAQLRYRRDFLVATDLSQPSTTTRSKPIAARGGDRSGRRSGGGGGSK